MIVAGAHGMFSAGYDIGEIPDEEFEERAEALVAHPFTEAIDALEVFPWPTLAVLPGHTIGGGLEVLGGDGQARLAGLLLHEPPGQGLHDQRPQPPLRVQRLEQLAQRQADAGQRGDGSFQGTHGGTSPFFGKR